MAELDFVKVDRGVIVERHLVVVDENYRPPVAVVSLRDRAAVAACVVALILGFGILGWVAS